MNKKKQI